MKRHVLVLAAATSLAATSLAPQVRANPPAICTKVKSGIVFPDSRPTTLGPAELDALLATGLADAPTLKARLDSDGAVVVSERVAVVKTAKGHVQIGLIDNVEPVSRTLNDPNTFWYSERFDTMTVTGVVTGTNPLVITVHRAIRDMDGDPSSHDDTTHLVDPKTGAILAALRCGHLEKARIDATWTRVGKDWRIDACRRSETLPETMVKTCATKPNAGVGNVRSWVVKTDALIAKGDEKSLETAIEHLRYATEVWAPTVATAGDVRELWLSLARAHSFATVKAMSFAKPDHVETAWSNAQIASKDSDYLRGVAMETAIAIASAALHALGAHDVATAPDAASIVSKVHSAIELFEIARGFGGPGPLIDQMVNTLRQRIAVTESPLETE